MKDLLNKISIILGVAALVTSSVESIKHFSDLINDYFWIVFFLALLFTLIPIWPESTKNKVDGFTTKPRPKENFIKKYKWVILISIGFAFVAAHRLYTIYIPTNGPYPIVQPVPVSTKEQEEVDPFNTEEFNKNIKNSTIDTLKNSTLVDKRIDSLNDNQLQLSSNLNKSDNSMLPILRQFTLNETKTSFIETNEVFAADVNKPRYRTFRLNPEVYSTIAPSHDNYPKCMCGWQSEEYDKTMNALRRYTKLTNKQELNKYFSSFVELEYLPRRHPGIVQKIIPKSDEWNNLTSDDYNAILRWVKCCIGIPYPTFIFSIENPSDSEIIIQEVKFNVKDIDQIRPREEGVLGPEATYVFELNYDVGTQTKQLKPSGFKIPAKTTKSFEVQLFTNHPDLGLCWLMNIEFVSNKGNCKTKDFQLIMSGKSEWSKGRFK